MTQPAIFLGQQVVLVGLGPLVLLLLVGVVVYLTSTSKNAGRAIGMLLGACFLAFLFMAVLWVGYANVEVANEQSKVAELAAQAKDTEELWEEMNRPRIKLNEEKASKSSTPPSFLSTVYDLALKDYASTKSKAKATQVAATEVVAEEQALDSSVVKEEPNTDESAKRPDWVDLPPKRVGNVYREVVVSGRYTRVTECHQDLDSRLRDVVRQRMQQLIGRYVPDLHSLGLSLDYVWSNICREEWIEKVDSSVGEMKRVHVLLEFDAAVDKRLEQAYRSYRRGHRIEEVGAVVAVVLGILAGIYALLKIDTWTRGYYTKRLFFGVPAAIILLLFMLLVA